MDVGPSPRWSGQNIDDRLKGRLQDTEQNLQVPFGLNDGLCPILRLHVGIGERPSITVIINEDHVINRVLSTWIVGGWGSFDVLLEVRDPMTVCSAHHAEVAEE